MLVISEHNTVKKLKVKYILLKILFRRTFGRFHWICLTLWYLWWRGIWRRIDSNRSQGTPLFRLLDNNDWNAGWQHWEGLWGNWRKWRWFYLKAGKFQRYRSKRSFSKFGRLRKAGNRGWIKWDFLSDFQTLWFNCYSWGTFRWKPWKRIEIRRRVNVIDRARWTDWTSFLSSFKTGTRSKRDWVSVY